LCREQGRGGEGNEKSDVTGSVFHQDAS
jgi:hypothetical protein